MSDSDVLLPKPSSSGKGFGELAIERGYCTRVQVFEAMRLQGRLAGQGVRKELSDLLLESKALSREQVRAVERALRGATVIAGFEILEKVGQGGMGAVFRARQINMERVVALKILPPKLAKDKAFKERFVREARVSAKLNHLNLINGIECGEAGGYTFFAMEFVEGRSVAGMLKGGKRLSPEESLKLVRQVADALVYAHKHGLVHRDIKPDNIMVTPQGVAKLCDLGLAKLETAKEDAALTQSGQAVGTPHYISPEQARGERDVDVRSDIYSLGVTFYHMLTGQTPFEGASAASIMAQHITEEAAGVCDLNPDAPEALGALVTKMLAKKPEDRYQDPGELIEDLEAAANEMPVRAWSFRGEASCAMPRKVPRRGALNPSSRSLPASPRRGTTGPLAPVPGDRTTRVGTAGARQAAAPTSLWAGVGAVAALLFGFLLFSSSGPGPTPRGGSAPSARNEDMARPPMPVRAPDPQVRAPAPAPAPPSRPAGEEVNPLGTFGPATNQGALVVEPAAAPPSAPAPEPAAKTESPSAAAKKQPPSARALALTGTVLKETVPLLRQGRLAEARELVARRRGEAANADASELLDGLKGELEGLAALRQRALEGLHGDAGSTVTLRLGNLPLTGVLTAGADRAQISLKLADGPEIPITAEALDARDVDKYAPPAGSKGDDLRLRGILYLVVEDFEKARELLTRATAEGSNALAVSWLQWVEFAQKEKNETAALKAWAEAEAHMQARRFSEAQAAYEAFRASYAATRAYAEQAATLAERLELLKKTLAPATPAIAAAKTTAPGLDGVYYNGPWDAPDWKAENVLLRRSDPNVDFDWGDGSPDAAVPNDNFRARWTGFLKVEKAGHYTFTAIVNDGCRLWLDERLVLERWLPVDRNAWRNRRGPLVGETDLAEGPHEFKLEFMEVEAHARCRLHWALRDGFDAQAIPAEAFSHASAPEPAAAPAPAGGLTALFVTGQGIPNADPLIRDRLKGLGFEVAEQSDTTVNSTHAAGKALIVVSSTIWSKAVDTRLRDVRVPVLVWEAALLDKLGMTQDPASDQGMTPGLTQLVLARPIGDLSGTLALYQSPQNVCWGRPNANAVKWAAVTDDPGKALVFGYEAGAAMPGLAAPARRMSIALHDNSPASLTPQGWAFFDAAVRWTAGKTAEKGPSPAPPAVAAPPRPAAQRADLSKVLFVPVLWRADGSADAVWTEREARSFEQAWKLDDPRGRAAGQFMKLNPAPGILASFKGQSGEIWDSSRNESCVLALRQLRPSRFRLEIQYSVPRGQKDQDFWSAGVGLWNGSNHGLLFGVRKITDGPLTVWGSVARDQPNVDEKNLPRPGPVRANWDQGQLAVLCDGGQWTFLYRVFNDTSESGWKEIYKMAATQSGFIPAVMPWTWEDGRVEFNVHTVHLNILAGDPVLQAP